MKNKIINVNLDEFHESSIRKKLKNIKNGNSVSFSVSSNFYNFHLTKELDNNLYNNYDFVLIEKGEYTFSLNRDFISFFINLATEYSLILVAINPISTENPSSENVLNYSNSEEDIINFFTSDYKTEKKMEFSFKNLPPKIIFLVSIFFIFFFSINSFSYFFYKKSLFLNTEINLSELKIKDYEDKIIIASNNSPPDLSSILYASNMKISKFLEIINDSSNAGIFLKKIEYQLNVVTIYGSARNFKAFLLFEDALEKNGIKKLNNDYVRRVDNFYDFTIDGKIVGD